MSRRILFVLAPIATCALALGRATAQEGGDGLRLELRVTSASAGAALVDRGASDGLVEGDRVRFRPREGGAPTGTVAHVEERSAVVEIDDLSFVPAPGTRAEVWIPRDRPRQHAPAPIAPPVPPAEPPPAEAAPEHPPWENRDDEWRAGLPLLARVRPVRPEERATRLSGRFTLIGDEIWTNDDGRSSRFWRAGLAALYENYAGLGGDLRFDGEFNQRTTDVPDDDDESEERLRLDRLSHAWGGSRFAPVRREVGRFLQHGLYELGELDGYEWSRRLDGGDGYGASVGFMPEPDLDHDTGQDFQLAAWYRWAFDPSDVLSATAGVQKTFHAGAADRDLIVARLAWLPTDAWTFHGTTWIDFYTAGDEAKGAGIELTQAYLTTRRAWAGGHSAFATYTHLAFPDIERDEFTQVDAAQLADDRNDRLAIGGRRVLARGTWVESELGAWSDEDDDGGDVELGVAIEDRVIDGGLFELSVFGTRGRFETLLGARALVGRATQNGRWSLVYETIGHHLEGFTEDNDDLPQQRLRAEREFHNVEGWTLAVHVEGQAWDDDHALLGGVYLQKGFAMEVDRR
jgi:hypothetical protein